MKRNLALLALFAAAFALGACCHVGHRGPAGQGAAPAAEAPAPGAKIYWCACGADCKCNAVATKPGTCACGKQMAGGHVVWTEGNTALACTCGPDCTCAIDPNDRAKCGCGKPIKRIDLKGTGLHFCNCGGGCGCNTVSDQPGRCKCGMPLQQAK